ncbi:MAG: phosphatase PAP2 family protein [Azoarcus sp.]|jgi:membrane-associated phospholipid phosphatase|nr:phosphatase PAP2 family protein [Azoarcus sp.]
MSVLSPSPPFDARAVFARVLLPAIVCVAFAAAVALFGVDETWFRAGNSFAAELLPVFLWAGITDLGSAQCIFALAAPLLNWRPRWVAAMILAAAPAAGLAYAIKKFVGEARPAAVLPPDEIHIVGKILTGNSSFPSGHTMTAFVFVGVVVLCVRRPWAWFMLLPAMLVAFSRIAVGAHWPVDLCAGAACGWLMAALGVWWSARWRFWEKASGLRILALFILLDALSLCFTDIGYPEGLWLQISAAILGGIAALHVLWKPLAVAA